MKKLYIPTSSLNFNNIFSTESISPYCFYGKRDFGYKRFETAPPNPLKNSLLLYTSCPTFEIKDYERENNPMVIEVPYSRIEGKANLVKTFENVGVYQIKETIFINPFETRIYFQSNKDLNNALVMAEASIETKMVLLYQNCLKVDTELSDKFRWSQDSISDINDSQSHNELESIEFDNKLNRIKGFAYCYLIGANSNSSPELLELRRLLKDIKNLSSGLLNLYHSEESSKRKSKTRNYSSYNGAKKLLDDFNAKGERFISIAENFNNQDSAKSNFEFETLKYFGFEEKEIEKIILFLKSLRSGRYSLYEHFSWAIKSSGQEPRTFNWIEKLRSIISYLNRLFIGEIDKRQYLALEEIDSVYLLAENSISDLEKELITKGSKLKAEDVFAISNLRLTSVFDEKLKNKSSFYQSVINELRDLYIENFEYFKANKADITRVFGRILKEFVEEVNKKDWNTSPERSYINSLLDNIESYHPFEIKSHTSEILQSFAAFILKGDDLEKLHGFLISNNFKDFRISFGLWGVTFGFAAIPKTMTEDFLTADINFTNSLIRSLTKQFFNYDVDQQMELNIVKRSIANKSMPFKTEETKVKSFEPSVIVNSQSDQVHNDYSKTKILCPICHSEMVIRKSSHGEFYGCSMFYKGCQGRLPIKKGNPLPVEKNILKDLIMDYVREYDLCKIEDVQTFILEKTSKKYNIGDIETFIKQNLLDELELKKIKQAKGVMRRKSGFLGIS